MWFLFSIAYNLSSPDALDIASGALVSNYDLHNHMWFNYLSMASIQTFICWLLYGASGKSSTMTIIIKHHPDSKVHGANMGTSWVLLAPCGPHCRPHEPCYLGSHWLWLYINNAWSLMQIAWYLNIQPMIIPSSYHQYELQYLTYIIAIHPRCIGISSHCPQCPLLLTWINFNPSRDKYSHA